MLLRENRAHHLEENGCGDDQGQQALSSFGNSLGRKKR